MVNNNDLYNDLDSGYDVIFKDDVRTVHCPKCGAPAKSPCLNGDGSEREANHKERVELFFPGAFHLPTRATVRGFVCPQCNAAASAFCMGMGGKQRFNSHYSRIRLAVDRIQRDEEEKAQEWDAYVDATLTALLERVAELERWMKRADQELNARDERLRALMLRIESLEEKDGVLSVLEEE